MAIATKIEEIGFRTLGSLPKPLRDAGIRAANKIRVVQMQKLQTPINMTLYVTNYCNAKCDHCFYWEELNTGKPELSLDDMRRIAKTLKHPLRTLMLTGGEPYLRKDLDEIIIAFHTINGTRRITTPTNGMTTERILAMTKKILAECPDLYFHVQVSLDGPEEMHDKFRRIPKCYQRASETLKQLLELRKTTKKLEVSVMTTICTANYDLLPVFVGEIKTKFPEVMHKFNILRGAHLGTYRVPKDVVSHLDGEVGKTESVAVEKLQELYDTLLLKEVETHRDKIWQNFQKLKWKYSIQMLATEKRVVTCTAGKTFGVIYPNGGVSVCEPTRPFANLNDFDMNFAALWKSQDADDMRKKTKACDCIHPCNLLDSMGYDTKTLIDIADLEKN
ncbi:MAG: radical SAM protein [bacterium]|nr:radical SAM protein [bacterium]